MLNPAAPGYHHHHQNLNTNPQRRREKEHNACMEEAMYGSDEFRMYAYKIKRCPRVRSHDWTECPYAHRGERAQRRDPLKFNYCGVVCPAFKTGSACHKGDLCEFSHGVFEYWLHPSRYRTRLCNAGLFCTRRVCFFAHSPHQLRHVTTFNTPNTSITSSSHQQHISSPLQNLDTEINNGESPDKFSEFLKAFRALKISDDEDPVLEKSKTSAAVADGTTSEMDLPHIHDWISELIQ